MSIYTFFVLQPYAFLAHNSEYNKPHCLQQHKKIPVLGKCKTLLNYKKVVTPITFIVANTNLQRVLNSTTSKTLNLIKRIFQFDANFPAFLKNYQDCFGVLETLQNTHNITVDPSVPPVTNPPMKIPFALQNRQKSELIRMTKIGIIKSVSEPTE